MLQFWLRAAEWRATNIAPFCDDPVGLPETFTVSVDLQTHDDAGFFGAPLVFLPRQVPDTRSILTGDKKHLLFDRGLPDPLTGGIFAQAHRLHEQMAEFLLPVALTKLYTIAVPFLPNCAHTLASRAVVRCKPVLGGR